MASASDANSLSALKLALLAGRLREREDDLALLEAEPVAIVGMACRLPGGVANPEALWQLLVARGDAITEVPADRWDAAAYFDANPAVPGKINTRCGGFIDGVDRFDPEFFGIAPKEALYMDPQHRLLLEVAWEAFDDSGCPLPSLRGSRTGVFFALYGSDYGRMQLARPDAISAHTVSGTAASMAAGRLSYLFNLRGPSIVVDTACSSSLVAVHAAVQSLQRRESDVAVAGGANVLLSPEETISLARWGMLAPDGRCKTFDAAADGFVRSEGCGLLVMKRLADALKSGDRIRAIIRGSAVNQDGRSNVLTAPNGEAQRELLRAALRRARLTPEDVTYVETHGTGTKVGDPIEVEALADVIGRPRADGSVCHLGAVKANIGHLEAAAGAAGLIKAVLCAEQGAIPPQPHFSSPNPLFSLDGTSLRIPVRLTPWESNGRPRIAGVSSFGFSGTNAHILLEEPPRLPARADRPERAQLLPISGKSEQALAAAVDSYRAFLGRGDLPPLRDVCHTAAVRREQHAVRAVAIGRTAGEMRESLHGFEPQPRAAGRKPRIAFVYSGQGSGAPGMAAGLLRDEPAFAAAIARCDQTLEPLAGWSIARALAASDGAGWLDDTERYQVVLFAVQVGLTELWRSWGVVPAAVAGHSVGEVAAAYAAGSLELDAALKIVMQRARLMKRDAHAGAMAVAALSPSAASALVRDFGDALCVAAHNGPESVTVAGTAAAVERFLSHPVLVDRFTRRLSVDRAFHSPAMEAAAAGLGAALAGLAPKSGQIAFYSSVEGGRIDGGQLTADYWRRNVREPVLFLEAANALLGDGYDCFIEIGPHPSVLSGIEAAAGAQRVTVLSSLRRGQDDRTTMLAALGQLYTAGIDCRWSAVADDDARCVGVPGYPWQRERLWFAPSPVERTRSREPADPQAALLGGRAQTAFLNGLLFENTLSEEAPHWLADHRIAGTCIVPAAAFIDMALTAVAQAAGGAERIELRDAQIARALALPKGEQRVVQVLVEPVGNDEWRVRIAARPAVAAASWDTHFECRARRGAPAPAAPGSAPGIAGQNLDIPSARHRMAARGIEFGPSFQALREVRYRADEAFAVLTEDSGPHAGHLLYPPHLDACLQALEAFFAESSAAHLPIGFEKLLLYRAPADIRGAHLQRRSSAADGGRDIVADLTIFDAAGECARVEGLRLHTANAAALAKIGAAADTTALLHTIEWETAGTERGAPLPGPWLVFADRGGLGRQFAARLVASGRNCTVVEKGSAFEAASEQRRVIDDRNPDHYARLLQERRYGAVVFLWGLDEESDSGDAPAATRAAVLLVKALGAASGTELWLVTRGAQRFPTAQGCFQAPLWGLGAVLAHERPALGRRMIELDPGDSLAAQSDALVAESAEPAKEDRIAWSSGRRSVARMRNLSAAAARDPDWIVRAPASGLIGDVRPVATPPVSPGRGELVIETRAVGLNFRDVLNALNMLGAEAPALGGECAGRVIALGDGVDQTLLHADVMAFAIGGLRGRVVLPASLVARLPAGMGYVEGASLPVAFLTAKYALEELAALKPRESVLIHAATGGVGLAAVQVARARGATVFATAGSEAKRAHLRSLGVEHVFSSRDTGFEEALRSITAGKGVDVVLNSLADDFIGASVGALARGGRFLELGKRGVWSREKMAAVRPDVRYMPFDLSAVAVEQPELIAKLFAELLGDLAAGRAEPLPVRSYALEELHAAFEYMAHAKHIGKLVLRSPQYASVQLKADATYLITGAAGGLAPALVNHLAEHGARHIAMLARRAPDAAAVEALAAVEAQGVVIRWLEADVADAAALGAALEKIDRELPPLRGVFHLAGVLRDAPLATLELGQLDAVARPKVRGAWLLHTLTRHRKLDMFVLFSSAASLIGWPGQAAYASGNAFLDALARWRASLGLPATAINWGPWRDVGMAAAATAAKSVDFAGRGLRPMTAFETSTALERSVESGAAQVIAAWIDAALLPAGSLTAGVVRRSTAAAEQPATVGRLRSEIIAAPPAKRRGLLAGAIEREAAKALGLRAGHRFEGARPLNDYGLDSLLAVQLSNALAALLDRPLPATLLFDYPTVDALTEMLLAGIDVSAAAPPPEAEQGHADALRDVSEADAEAMLLAELGALSRLQEDS